MLVRRWWLERTQDSIDRLLARCEEWIEQVLCNQVDEVGLRGTVRSAFPQAGAAAIDVREHLKLHVFTYTGDQIREPTDRFLDNEVRHDPLNEGRRRVLEFLDVLEQHFPEFVEALFYYFLLSRSTTRVHRRWAALNLIIRLWTPLARAAALRGNPPDVVAEAHLRLFEPNDLSGKDHRLIRKWVGQPPSGFGHALAQAVNTLLRWDISNLLEQGNAMQSSERDEEDDRSAIEMLPVGAAELRASRVCKPKPAHTDLTLAPDLLENLYNLACLTAAQFPTADGGHVLLWLMLGGVSHGENPPDPWKEVGRLVQPEFIQALKMMPPFGKNFVQRVYRVEIGRLMESNGLLAVIRAKMVDLLLAKGRDSGDCPEITKAGSVRDLIDAAQNLGVPIFPGWHKPGHEKNLGWEMFLGVSQHTARLLQRGDLLPKPPATFAASSFAPRDLIDWLGNTALVGPIQREEVAWVAQELCGMFPKASDWTLFLKTF